MLREISAGGVLVRPQDGVWQAAVIEPQREPPPPGRRSRKPPRPVLALPKGLVDPGEKPEQTALREVLEETGAQGELLTKLGDIKYVYSRTWAGGERVFKIVSFYLLRYISGQLGDISEEMRTEVQAVHWMPLEDAARRLSYSGERQMARRALEYLDKTSPSD